MLVARTKGTKIKQNTANATPPQSPTQLKLKRDIT